MRNYPNAFSIFLLKTLTDVIVGFSYRQRLGQIDKLIKVTLCIWAHIQMKAMKLVHRYIDYYKERQLYLKMKLNESYLLFELNPLPGISNMF